MNIIVYIPIYISIFLFLEVLVYKCYPCMYIELKIGKNEDKCMLISKSLGPNYELTSRLSKKQ